MLLGRGGSEEPSGPTGPQRRKRRAYEAPGSREARFSHLFQRKDERCRRFDHSKSLWWDDLNHPEVYNESSGAGRRFRRKFRVPKVVVDKLVTEASKQPKWGDKPFGPGHGRGPARAPLVLKVLAALVYLGKGAGYEELETLSQVSVPTLQKFIPSFLKWLATTEFSKHVYLPHGQTLDSALHVYERLGSPGVCCSPCPPLPLPTPSPPLPGPH